MNQYVLLFLIDNEGVVHYSVMDKELYAISSEFLGVPVQESDDELFLQGEANYYNLCESFK